MIRIEELKKRYDRYEALRGVSISVEAGELFGFLGPNGAGKTTTLMILAGLLEPTAGRVSVCGFDVQTQPLEVRRRLGYVPDRPYVYEKLAGRELLRFFADVYGVEREEAGRLTDHWLEVFSLTTHAGELVEAYSHGMRQRCILAATFLVDPEVIVLDEPMVGLDPAGARLLKDLLRQRCQAGKSVLMSTHTLQVAEETCDRVAIINRGELVAVGTVDELRERLANDGASLEEIFLEMVARAEAAP